MKNWYEKILSITFIFALSIFLIYGIIKQDSDVSFLENRTLKQLPAFSVTEIISGNWMDEVESYFNDQFPGRSIVMKYYTKIEFLLNKTFVRGLMTTEDNIIIHNPANEKSREELSGNVEQLTKLKEKAENKEGTFYYFLAPHKTNSLTYLLPNYIDSSPYKKNMNNLKELSKDVEVHQLYNDFIENEKIIDWTSLYFRSDHHWNMDGAILGYKTIIDIISKDHPSICTVDLNEYERKVVNTEKFIGSWNRQLINIIDPSLDNPIYYETEFPLFNIKYGSSELDLKSSSYEEIFATGIREKKETVNYSTSYMSDYPILTIKQNDNDKNLKTLVIKDSYANPIIFHLASNFSETTVIDVRHYKSTVAEHLNNYNYDIVMVLYSDNTLNKNMYQFGF